MAYRFLDRVTTFQREKIRILSNIDLPDMTVVKAKLRPCGANNMLTLKTASGNANPAPNQFLSRNLLDKMQEETVACGS